MCAARTVRTRPRALAPSCRRGHLRVPTGSPSQALERHCTSGARVELDRVCAHHAPSPSHVGVGTFAGNHTLCTPCAHAEHLFGRPHALVSFTLFYRTRQRGLTLFVCGGGGVGVQASGATRRLCATRRRPPPRPQRCATLTGGKMPTPVGVFAAFRWLHPQIRPTHARPQCVRRSEQSRPGRHTPFVEHCTEHCAGGWGQQVTTTTRKPQKVTCDVFVDNQGL